jgi:PAS domain S-box-containing protein
MSNTDVAAQRATVLVVDDLPDNLALMSSLLERDYKVKVANSGEKALRIAASQAPPDLIILDIMMPDMDGYEVAGRLKANPVTANIPIIMATAHTDQGAKVAGLNAGAEDFLSKPIDPVEIGLRVRNQLRLKGLSDLVRGHNETLEEEVKARATDLLAFRQAMDTTMEGIFLVSRATMQFVEINATGGAMLGYTRQELLLLGPGEVIGSSDQQLSDTYDALIAGGTAGSTTEFQLVCKSGALFDAEVHRHVQRFGEDWLIVSLVRDVTERKRLERQTQSYLEQIRTAFMSTVEVATTISEMRDPYTAGHERRVATIAVAIGAELGFDGLRQEGLRVSGHLHDIGKITIPSEILSKPGKISPIEYMLIQQHAQAGYDVLKGVTFPWPVAEVAFQHHERMDGSGYPRGLKGEEILLEARIMAVADVFEAMSSHPPLSGGHGHGGRAGGD